MCNPIIFARGHQLVNLLLRYLHEKRAHCGYKILMYESRKRFWTVGVRNMAKQVTGKCMTCKKLRSQPLEQMMGQIPRLYIAAGFPAFSNTAIHMFGPLQIRIGSKILKVALVIIFTCMTTETVYLELVTHRSSDTLLMAFRRFASLRGQRYELCRRTKLFERNIARLGHPQNSKCLIRIIFMPFPLEVEHTTS